MKPGMSLNDLKKNDHSKATKKFAGHLAGAAHHAGLMGLAQEIEGDKELPAPRDKDYKKLGAEHKKLAEAHIGAAHKMASADPGLWSYAHEHAAQSKSGSMHPFQMAATITAMHPEAGIGGRHNEKVVNWANAAASAPDAPIGKLHLPAAKPRKPGAKDVMGQISDMGDGVSMYDAHGGGFGGEKDVGKSHPADKLLERKGK